MLWLRSVGLLTDVTFTGLGFSPEESRDWGWTVFSGSEIMSSFYAF